MRFLTQATAAFATTMLLAATPATANLSDDDVEAIYQLSKEICPGAFSETVQDAGAYLMKVAQDEKLSDSETLLLANFCLSYGEGLVRGVTEG